MAKVCLFQGTFSLMTWLIGSPKSREELINHSIDWIQSFASPAQWWTGKGTIQGLTLRYSFVRGPRLFQCQLLQNLRRNFACNLYAASNRYVQISLVVTRSFKKKFTLANEYLQVNRICFFFFLLTRLAWSQSFVFCCCFFEKPVLELHVEAISKLMSSSWVSFGSVFRSAALTLSRTNVIIMAKCQ